MLYISLNQSSLFFSVLECTQYIYTYQNYHLLTAELNDFWKIILSGIFLTWTSCVLMDAAAEVVFWTQCLIKSC